MIGDQLFMDILGANLLNIYSIYIRHGKPEIFLAADLDAPGRGLAAGAVRLTPGALA